MKTGIHPNYVESLVECGCGNKFKTRSTIPNIHIEICSVCHPFYTGKQKFVDTAGRVEKFQRRFDWKDESTTGVISKVAEEREKKREQLAAQEAEKRNEIGRRKKANAERRSKLLDRKKRVYEAKTAAEEAAAAAASAAAAPAPTAAPQESPAPATPPSGST